MSLARRNRREVESINPFNMMAVRAAYIDVYNTCVAGMVRMVGGLTKESPFVTGRYMNNFLLGSGIADWHFTEKPPGGSRAGVASSVNSRAKTKGARMSATIEGQSNVQHLLKQINTIGIENRTPYALGAETRNVRFTDRIADNFISKIISSLRG